MKKTLYDPHTWLDPEKAGEEAQIIADKLSEVDSEHKETYQKNAQAFIKKAQELTKKFQPRFEKASQKTFVTQHNSLFLSSEAIWTQSTWNRWYLS